MEQRSRFQAHSRVALVAACASPTLGIMVVFALSFAPVGAQAFDYVIFECPDGVCDVPVYAVPDIPRPAKGESIQDPNFNTTITRISDQGMDQYIGSRMVNAYSTVDIENTNGTKIILTSGKWYIYDTNSFELVDRLSYGDGGEIPSRQDLEARWDDDNPNIFYYRMDMQFFKYNLVTRTSTLIRDFQDDFPTGGQVLAATKGAPSMDKRYWAFSVKRGYAPYHMIAAFTYDLELDSIVGRIDPSENHRYMTMSPNGNRAVVSYYWPGQVTSYDLDFNDPIEVGTLAHTDYALDAAGRQMRVFADPTNDVVAMINLKTGERTNILDLPLTGDWDTEPAGIHISGVNYDTPGWVLVSTYGTEEDAYGTWAHNLLFMLELKENPRIWLIAHTHCPQADADDYWAEAFATTNRSGTKIYWGSNWDNPGNDSQIDAYQVTLPADWWFDLGNAGGVIDGQSEEIPTGVHLRPSYPNPFSPSTTIEFALSQQGAVVIDVLDIKGRRVRRLVDESFDAGVHQVVWNGRSSGGHLMPSGVYLYRVVTKGQSITNRMLLLE